MVIKRAETEEGLKVKVIQFSLENISSQRNAGALREVMENRLAMVYRTREYTELNEEFQSHYKDILKKAPELKTMLMNIDSTVTAKEVCCFDEGYRAGMADLMTALTFNDLQITHAGIIDCEARDNVAAGREI